MHRERRLPKANGPSSEVSIPEKLYFRIGEVSQLVQTKPYVLRYWETEFPTLKPSKTRTGRRVYRRKDVETVFQIKRLLYEQGFTIEGARKQIASNSKGDASRPEQAQLFAPRKGPALNSVERELRSILTILSRKC